LVLPQRRKAPEVTLKRFIKVVYQQNFCRITTFVMCVLSGLLLPAVGAAIEAQNPLDKTETPIDDTNVSFSEIDGRFEYRTGINVTASRPDITSVDAQLPAFVTVIQLHGNLPRFQTLPELLSSAVGVTVRDFGGLGKLSTISIRGSSANQVVVLLDGVRINTASDSGVDLSSLPMDTIEKIEILRGADSAVFGSGAIGGVVNLVSRKDSPPGWSGSGSISFGSWNTLNTNVGTWLKQDNYRVSMTAGIKRTNGDFSFLNDSGTTFNPDDDFRDRRSNNAMDAYEAAVRFQSTALPNSTLSGNIEGFYADKGIPGMTTFPSERATQTDRRLTANLRLETRVFGDDAHLFFVEPQIKYLAMNFEDLLGEQTGVPIFTRQRTDTAGIRAGWSYSDYYSGGGLSFHYDSETLTDNFFGDVSRDAFAVNARFEHAVAPDSLWVSSHLRYDHLSDAGTHWSPKLGLRWFVTDRLSIKSNVGYGFRAPSFNELYLEAGYTTGNPDLKPENAVSLDAGILYEARRWRIETAWFRIDADDLIQYQLVAGFRYKPFNIGRSRSEGFEIDVSISPGGGFTFSGSYTLDRAVDRSGEPNLDGKILPGRPEHDMFTRLSWTGKKLTLWTESHYLSGNYVTRANTKKLDNRLTGNAGFSWNFGPHLQAGFEVKNITASEVVDVRGFPLPGRAFFASAKITF
jgi:vitamin B12 transporter